MLTNVCYLTLKIPLEASVLTHFTELDLPQPPSCPSIYHVNLYCCLQQQNLNASWWDSSSKLFSNYKTDLEKKNHQKQKQPQRNMEILFTACCIPGNLHWKLQRTKFVTVTKCIKLTYQSLKWDLNPKDMKINQLLTVWLWFWREFETDNGQDYENDDRPGN